MHRSGFALAGALAIVLAACGKEAAPPPAAAPDVKPPMPSKAAPAEAIKVEAPSAPPAKASLGPGDLAIGTTFDGLKASQFFWRLVMADEPGGPGFGGKTVIAFLEDTRVDLAKGIHFCVQNKDASAFGGRKAKGEYQVFTPNLLNRDPLAAPAHAVNCVPPGDTLWNEIRRVENAGLPRGQAEIYSQPARVEIELRQGRVDRVELRFHPSGPDAFNAIKSGFALEVGGLVEPPKEQAAVDEGCSILVPSSGAPAYLLKKGPEVNVVFGAAPTTDCPAREAASKAGPVPQSPGVTQK